MILLNKIYESIRERSVASLGSTFVPESITVTRRAAAIYLERRKFSIIGKVGRSSDKSLFSTSLVYSLLVKVIVGNLSRTLPVEIECSE